mmetsp:Transcript_4632/g.10310  ORF Transcript_4632/g.10310 Transcript_4632/m.10310 type:complete len:100 (-) Transcript_4632:703-1002(-)
MSAPPAVQVAAAACLKSQFTRASTVRRRKSHGVQRAHGEFAQSSAVREHVAEQPPDKFESVDKIQSRPTNHDLWDTFIFVDIWSCKFPDNLFAGTSPPF